MFFLSLALPAFAGEPKTVLEVEKATDTYFKNKNWTPFAAAIRLSFFKNEEEKDSCLGPLLFDPLRKKLLVECYDNAGKPVFIFRNNDVEFLLYVPGMKKAWEGNIFDLQYSPSFDSHLKPLDLYRALSAEAFSENQAINAYSVKEGMELEIAKPYQQTTFLARRLVLDEKGQVRHETFLAPTGEELTIVVRDNFKEIPNSVDPVTQKFFYAPSTSVTHPETGDKTVLEMTHVTLYPEFPEEAWAMWLPEETPVEKVTKT